MNVEQMVERLREHGYLPWHIGCSTKGVWTANFCNFYEFMERRGQRGPRIGYMDNSEISVTMQGDTMHEAIKNVMEDVCPLSQPEPEYDMDAMLGLKPEKIDTSGLDLAAMLR